MATGKANTFIADYLKLLFNNTSIANIGDAGGLIHSTTAGSLYLSLHTGDPGAAGTQQTSEAAYTGYTRVAVARASGAGGFTVTGQTVTLTTATNFPVGTAGGEACTYLGVGRDSSGTGELLYRCTLSITINTGNGVTPTIGTSTGITES